MSADINVAKNKSVIVSRDLGGTAANIGLLLTYIIAVWPSLNWILAQIDPAARLFIAVGVAFAIGAAIKVWGPPSRLMPLLPVLGLGLCAAASLFFYPILQQLSAAFALLGLSIFLTALKGFALQSWRRNLIMAGLAALALPFALVPGTGFGFYLRLLTADAAANILALLGHGSLGAHDVLIFDNGIAQVDLPCSGLKSLFTGTGFFLVASLILRRSVSLTWLIGYGIFVGLLVAANTIRVSTLIWISEIAQNREFAETIHMPLGLFLFGLCCLAGLYYLIRLPADQKSVSMEAGFWMRSNWPVLAGVFIVLMIFAVMFNPASPDRNSPIQIAAPAGMDLNEVGLTQVEIEFFAQRHQTSARKWQFSQGDLSGSILVVQSRAANGLHAPEVCLLGNGISVDHMQSVNIPGNGQMRLLDVDDRRRSAIYWMQSGDTITDDFRRRLSGFIFRGQSEWTMVTLLFDQRLSADAIAADDGALSRVIKDLQVQYAGSANKENSI